MLLANPYNADVRSFSGRPDGTCLIPGQTSMLKCRRGYRLARAGSTDQMLEDRPWHRVISQTWVEYKQPS